MQAQADSELLRLKESFGLNITNVGITISYDLSFLVCQSHHFPSVLNDLKIFLSKHLDIARLHIPSSLDIGLHIPRPTLHPSPTPSRMRLWNPLQPISCLSLLSQSQANIFVSHFNQPCSSSLIPCAHLPFMENTIFLPSVRRPF